MLALRARQQYSDGIVLAPYWAHIGPFWAIFGSVSAVLDLGISMSLNFRLCPAFAKNTKNIRKKYNLWTTALLMVFAAIFVCFFFFLGAYLRCLMKRKAPSCLLGKGAALKF